MREPVRWGRDSRDEWGCGERRPHQTLRGHRPHRDRPLRQDRRGHASACVPASCLGERPRPRGQPPKCRVGTRSACRCARRGAAAPPRAQEGALLAQDPQEPQEAPPTRPCPPAHERHQAGGRAHRRGGTRTCVGSHCPAGPRSLTGPRPSERPRIRLGIPDLDAAPRPRRTCGERHGRPAELECDRRRRILRRRLARAGTGRNGIRGERNLLQPPGGAGRDR